MKCSLKDGFINILLIIFIIAPSEGIEFPLLLRRSSVLDKPMNLQQFRASINRLQDLDSFPGNSDNQLHRIVKKQMTGSDYVDARRTKRALVRSPRTAEGFARGGAGDGADVNRKDGEKAEEAVNKAAFLKARNAETTATESFLKRLKEFAKGKESLFLRGSKRPVTPHKTGGKSDTGEEDQMQEGIEKEDVAVKGMTKAEYGPKNVTGGTSRCENSCLSKECRRIPDQFDYRYYYECEVNANGCLKLRHKRCPKGQFFSYKYLKCLKGDKRKIPLFRRKKSAMDCGCPKKPDLPDSGSEDPEPSNEWLDASQGVVQKIPSEFKPKKKPDLKIYHLRVKRTPDKRLRKEALEADREWDKLGVTDVNGKRVQGKLVNDASKTIGTKHHKPRSFVIRINKKEGKGDQITESNENENDSDEDDEETDEEDEDEEADEEDEESESESEDSKEITQEKPRKETLKDLLKSAKEAVTNRARFEDPTQIAPRAIKEEKDDSSLKSKKPDDDSKKGPTDKKVLIDANIKVDSTIGSVFRNFLKNKRKDLEANIVSEDARAFVSDRESQDKLDPELIRMYENLMRNNPRVKRYFQSNCSARRN